MLLPDPVPPRADREHTRAHGRHPITGCWRCQREYARCLSKVAFETRQAVDAAVTEINEREDYREPVMRYVCRWSTPDVLHWHIGHARKPRDVKRARRAWRRWRARAEAS